MNEPLHRRSAVDLARMIAQGEVAPETVTRSLVDAIHERENQVQAFAWFDVDRAMAAARELHRVARRGPLHGLAIAVKDNIDTADMPTAYGSSIYLGHMPSIDAACVALLKDAGAFVLGKTVTTEMANFTPGPTRNPHHLEHTPGGSSSGSAAAVAAYFTPIALGTQTAGSVIRPAAFCGVAAYKPSARMIPRAGVKPNSDSLDEVGVFARHVDDLILAASVLTAKPGWLDLLAMPEDDAPPAPEPAVTLTRTPHDARAAPAQIAAVERLLHTAAAGGARVVDTVWPRVFDGLFDAQHTVQLFETARALAAEFSYRRAKLSQGLVDVIEQGRGVSTADYRAALQLGRACTAAIDSLFGAAEVILAPSAPGEAPLGLTTGDPLFNRPWQLLGCPVVNLPVGRGPGGLPLGASLVARPGDDQRLLATALWLERCMAKSSGG